MYWNRSFLARILDGDFRPVPVLSSLVISSGPWVAIFEMACSPFIQIYLYLYFTALLYLLLLAPLYLLRLRFRSVSATHHGHSVRFNSLC